MNAERKKLITQWVVALACAFAIASFVFASKNFAAGAVAGGIVAVANWITIRWAISRVEHSTSGASWGVVLGIKFFGALAASAFALAVLHVHPLGFMLGLSPFVFGLVLGTVWPLPSMIEER